MSERIAEIDARVNAATPGPWAKKEWEYESDEPAWTIDGGAWEWRDGRGRVTNPGPGSYRDYEFEVVGSESNDWGMFGTIQSEGDAEFIANARSDVPWLLEQLRAAEQENADLWTAQKADLDYWQGRTKDAEDRVEAARALHYDADTGPATGPDRHYCMADGESYPCPTIRALTSDSGGL